MAPRASLGAIISLIPFVALLAWLSTTSTIAAFSALPSKAVVAAAEAQTAVTVEEARKAGSANIRAAKWFDGAQYRLHAARALLALPAPLRQREQPLIERLTRTSLAAAPMSAYGWTLLAFLRLDRQDVTGAAKAWEMSVSVGRYVPNLMQSRLLLGIEILRHDPRLVGSVVDQIRVLAEADPSSLAIAARRGGVEAPVRAALIDSSQSAGFERETKLLVAGAGERLRQRARTAP